MEQGKPLLKVYALNLPYRRLAEQVANFRRACTDPQAEYTHTAESLYSLLIAPASKQLAGKRRLIVCPDGPLWGLPFQALMSKTGKENNDTFLVQQFEVDYGYSATAVQAALRLKSDPHRPKPSNTLLACANPAFGDLTQGAKNTTDADGRPIDLGSRAVFGIGRDGLAPLPRTQEEADALRKYFPGSAPDVKILTGKDAQKATVMAEASQYRYLHFATHGVFNAAAPLLSCIVLAQPTKRTGSDATAEASEDQFLTARDFFDLNLSADMVVLSACNTAQGERQAGEGVMGLTWALFVAGVPSEVVSQWSVNDESTTKLMQNFYANLTQQKTAKGAALRKAALKLMQDKTHQHPFYWAPFILMGDWSGT